VDGGGAVAHPAMPQSRPNYISHVSGATYCFTHCCFFSFGRMMCVMCHSKGFRTLIPKKCMSTCSSVRCNTRT
jgi:hypothetical protein